MEILIISQYFWPENFKINDLAIRLKELNHNVTVLTGKPNYPKGNYFDGYKIFNKRTESYKGIKVIRTNLISRGNNSGLRLVLNYLSFAVFASFAAVFRLKKKADVIFVYEPSPITVGVPAIVYKFFSKAPIFFWVQDLWPESITAAGKIKSPFVLRLINGIVKFIYNNSDVIFVSSKSFIESITQKNVPPDKIKYLPNWAEEIFLMEQSQVKSDISIPQGFRIIFAGNIGDAQDFESIIRAVEITKNNDKIKWIIIGDGRKKKWVEKQKEEKGLKNLYLIGKLPIESIPYCFEQADALLVSLKSEEIFALTVPAKIQTYLAFGKPVLAMINGEGAQIIDESKSGFSVSAGNYTNLAQKAIEMSEMSSVKLDEMSSSGRDYYNKRFNRENLIDFVINEFELKIRVK